MPDARFRTCSGAWRCDVRLFELRRDEVVAQGVIFDNGKCALTWLTEYRSVSAYDSIDDVVAVHGHETKIVQFADIDRDTVSALVNNEAQDEMENIIVDFRGLNHRAVWNDRGKFADMFVTKELVDDRTAVDHLKEATRVD